METAGKDMDDDDMRDLMKDNGIGRPSTRASIIETLFRRKYIKRNKKQILPTPTGIDLINTIQNQLLKSAELTGRWEGKLKEIEKGQYNAGAFIKQMKGMVDQLVYEVRSDQQNRTISTSSEIVNKKPKVEKKKRMSVQGHVCPKCKKGSLMKGSNAFGCSEFKNGCNFLLPFRFMDKKISENQYLRLLQKSETVQLKGFVEDGIKTNGKICFTDDFDLKLQKKVSVSSNQKKVISKCPKCGTGELLKGKKAYGCSNYNNGCDFILPFERIRSLADGKPLTAEFVNKLISNYKPN